MDKLLEEVEKKIECYVEKGIEENINMISKLIDIHKDLENEKYWKEKEEYYEIQRRRLWQTQLW